MLSPPFLPNRPRQAFTSTELIVASTLMVATMGIIGPLAVRAARLWQSSRHQQVAIEALSDELERLTAMESDVRSEAIQNLIPSEALRLAAPDALLTAEVMKDSDGTRLVVTLDWNQPDEFRPPLKLVGWLDPLPQEDAP
jgi:hypothetical protein